MQTILLYRTETVEYASWLCAWCWRDSKLQESIENIFNEGWRQIFTQCRISAGQILISWPYVSHTEIFRVARLSNYPSNDGWLLQCLNCHYYYYYEKRNNNTTDSMKQINMHAKGVQDDLTYFRYAKSRIFSITLGILGD